MSRPVQLAYATFVLAGLGAGVSGVLLPAQPRDYGIDEPTSGWTSLSSSAGFGSAGLASGPILHRLGLRLSLALGGLAFAAGALAAAGRPPFALFVAVQFLLGFGSGLAESL